MIFIAKLAFSFHVVAPMGENEAWKGTPVKQRTLLSNTPRILPPPSCLGCIVTHILISIIMWIILNIPRDSRLRHDRPTGIFCHKGDKSPITSFH